MTQQLCLLALELLVRKHVLLVKLAQLLELLHRLVCQSAGRGRRSAWPGSAGAACWAAAASSCRCASFASLCFLAAKAAPPTTAARRLRWRLSSHLQILLDSIALPPDRRGPCPHVMPLGRGSQPGGAATVRQRPDDVWAIRLATDGGGRSGSCVCSSEIERSQGIGHHPNQTIFGQLRAGCQDFGGDGSASSGRVASLPRVPTSSRPSRISCDLAMTRRLGAVPWNRRHTRENSSFRPAAKGATPWRTLRPPLRVRRRSGHASATGGTPGRRRYPTPRPGSERHGARRRGRWRRAPGMANGSRHPIGLIRSSSWRSRLPLGCPSWCRSATGGCWCRRSRSSAARPTRWRPTWPVRPGPGYRCSSAAMRICPTSVGSPRPTGGWCSASTTSTRRCRARSSGT